MITDLARQDHAAAQPDGLLDRAALQVRRFVCGLHGHDALLHFSEGHISLLCASCGHESPGWDIAGGRGRTARTQPTAQRRPIVHLPLLGQRRVA